MEMSDFSNRSQSSARHGDYVWQYEYYDDEEPVSFEGLKAHRYSIVIGFWVGLAVFVIFMFFVLTLLTKTGAPHPENPESAAKDRPGSCLVDINGPREENDSAFSRPLLSESRPFFHFYISEDNPGQRQESRFGSQTGATQGTCSRLLRAGQMEEYCEDGGDEPPLKELAEERRADRDRECAFFSQFNIPNFVNLDRSSSLGEDDLLYEPSVVLEQQSHSRDAHFDVR